MVETLYIVAHWIHWIRGLVAPRGLDERCVGGHGSQGGKESTKQFASFDRDLMGNLM